VREGVLSSIPIYPWTLVASRHGGCVRGVLGSSNHEEGADVQPRAEFKIGFRSGVAVPICLSR
jgi:hypothetical protein